MTVESLERLGSVIQAIRQHTAEESVVFWTFISYMSAHPSDLLQAEPPEELAASVAKLQESIELPIVDLELKEMEDRGPPMNTVDTPPRLFKAYTSKYEFVAIASVQVRDQMGTVAKAILMEGDEGPILAIPQDSDIMTDKLTAIRKTPGCLTGWLLRPPWLS